MDQSWGLRPLSGGQASWLEEQPSVPLETVSERCLRKPNHQSGRNAGNTRWMNKLSSSGKAPVMFRSYCKVGLCVFNRRLELTADPAKSPDVRLISARYARSNRRQISPSKSVR